MIMNIESLYHVFCEAGAVTTDSRNCPSGSVFFALKGDSFNGNLYAAKALEAGSAYAVVDEAEVVRSERFILVNDVLRTLQELANYHRKQMAMPIIAITGSNGKTTTKELLATALMPKYKLHYTQGNFNNHIGVPLTLLQLTKDHELAIVEMGANHPKEIGELAAIAEPDYGIITNIGKAHLEGFGGLEGVIKTKKELYDFVQETEGKVFVNAQDELLMNLSAGIERILYNDELSSFELSVINAIPTLNVAIKGKSGDDELKTQLAGEYNAINLAVALEVGDYFDVPYSDMKSALEAYEPSNNRSQIVKTEKNTVVLDAYNANPASMAVAIANFKNLPDKNKVLMLGAMKEMGAYSKAEHQNLVDLVDVDDFTEKYLVGEEFKVLDTKPESINFFSNTEDLKTYLNQKTISGSTVLVKGSRSMKMETLIDFL